MKFFIFLLAFTTVGCYCESPNTYNGYKVFSINPDTPDQISLAGLLREATDVDVLSEFHNKEVRLLVPPYQVIPMIMVLDVFNATYTMSNFVLIRSKETEIMNSRRTMTPNYKISFHRYNRYHTIVAYLKGVAGKYPNNAMLLNLGKSSEGRDIYALKISTGGFGKPAILVDAGIHAREWTAPAIALYLIKQLVEVKGNRYLSANIDWYIIPLMNPDGYEYSHMHDRLWRKTRSKGEKCYGADINRNFGFHWMDVGSSTNDCSGQYAGAYAYSEPETVALRDFVLNHANFIKLYVSLHSYGSMLLYPWGYTTKLPRNADELHHVADLVIGAIRTVRGTNYTTGSSSNVLYPASGASDDWIKGFAKVPLSYTMELPYGGKNGFDGPESEIYDMARESFEGFKEFAKYVAQTWSRVHGGKHYSTLNKWN